MKLDASAQGVYVIAPTPFHPDGRTLFSSSQLVQRPPDRILRQFGGIDGQIGGHPVICSTDQHDVFTCRTGTTAVPPADDPLAPATNVGSY